MMAPSPRDRRAKSNSGATLPRAPRHQQRPAVASSSRTGGCWRPHGDRRIYEQRVKAGAQPGASGRAVIIAGEIKADQQQEHRGAVSG